MWMALDEKICDLGIRHDVWMVGGKIAYYKHIDWLGSISKCSMDISNEAALTIMAFESIDEDMFHALVHFGVDVVAAIVASGSYES